MTRQSIPTVPPWQVAQWWALHKDDPSIRASLERAEKRPEKTITLLLGAALALYALGRQLAR